MKNRNREDEILEDAINELGDVADEARLACDALDCAGTVETLSDYIANVVDAGLQFDALAKKCATLANAARCAKKKASR